MDSTQFLVTLDEVKDYLGYTDDDTDRDNNIGLFINLVSTMCENYTDRNLIEQEYTEYYDGSGNNRLLLVQYPVTDDESSIDVRIDTSRDFGESTKLDEDDIGVHQEVGLIYYLEGVWGTAPRSIKVVYNAGYSTIPYDLRLSILEAVGYFWKRKNEKNWGVQSISKSETSVTKFQTSLPETVKQIWDTYRRWR